MIGITTHPGTASLDKDKENEAVVTPEMSSATSTGILVG